MKIDLEEIDSVFYVELDTSLLPKRIFRINSKDIEYTTDKRVSFKKAFEENRAEIIYQDKGTVKTPE